jgi:hypothetical protein
MALDAAQALDRSTYAEITSSVFLECVPVLASAQVVDAEVLSVLNQSCLPEF